MSGELFPVNAACDLFEKFWAVYPLRVAKDAARASFAKAAVRAARQGGAETLILRARLFAEVSVSWDKKFLPRATTWLNQNRWNDDIEDVRRAYARPTTRSDERLAERGASLGRMFAGALAAADQQGKDEGRSPEDRR